MRIIGTPDPVGFYKRHYLNWQAGDGAITIAGEAFAFVPARDDDPDVVRAVTAFASRTDIQLMQFLSFCEESDPVYYIDEMATRALRHTVLKAGRAELHNRKVKRFKAQHGLTDDEFDDPVNLTLFDLQFPGARS